jgi:hypothetical protein
LDGFAETPPDLGHGQIAGGQSGVGDDDASEALRMFCGHPRPPAVAIVDLAIHWYIREFGKICEVFVRCAQRLHVANILPCANFSTKRTPLRKCAPILLEMIRRS